MPLNKKPNQNFVTFQAFMTALIFSGMDFTNLKQHSFTKGLELSRMVE